MMGGFDTDLYTFGAGIGFYFKVFVHVVLSLHSDPQLLGTIVPGIL